MLHLLSLSLSIPSLLISSFLSGFLKVDFFSLFVFIFVFLLPQRRSTVFLEFSGGFSGHIHEFPGYGFFGFVFRCFA